MINDIMNTIMTDIMLEGDAEIIREFPKSRINSINGEIYATMGFKSLTTSDYDTVGHYYKDAAVVFGFNIYAKSTVSQDDFFGYIDDVFISTLLGQSYPVTQIKMGEISYDSVTQRYQISGEFSVHVTISQ